MSDILEKIRLYKLDEVAHRKSRASLADLDRAASAAGPPRGFKVALSRDAGPGRPMNPRLRAFLLFILGPEGQALAEKPGGYLPLAPAAQAAAIACVRGAGRGD